MSRRSHEKAEGGDDQLPPEEADRRRDDALRRALSMPPLRERARPSSDRVQQKADRPKKQAKSSSR